jgi:hypothetical protein
MNKIETISQLEAIERTRKKATRSKAAALKFLRDAGIIQDKKSIPKPKQKK